MIDAVVQLAASDAAEATDLSNYVTVPRRVTLSSGRTVTVRVMRREDAAPWSDEDEVALRAILDVAAACVLSEFPTHPDVREHEQEYPNVAD